MQNLIKNNWTAGHLPGVKGSAEFLPARPKIASLWLQLTGVHWMGSHTQCALASNVFQNIHHVLIGVDPLADAQSKYMRGAVAGQSIFRDFNSGNNHHPVKFPSSLRLKLNAFKIALKMLLIEGSIEPVCSFSKKRLRFAEMVGDRDGTEPILAIKVHKFFQTEPTVTPRGMKMKISQKHLFQINKSDVLWC